MPKQTSTVEPDVAVGALLALRMEQRQGDIRNLSVELKNPNLPDSGRTQLAITIASIQAEIAAYQKDADYVAHIAEQKRTADAFAAFVSESVQAEETELRKLRAEFEAHLAEHAAQGSGT